MKSRDGDILTDKTELSKEVETFYADLNDTKVRPTAKDKLTINEVKGNLPVYQQLKSLMFWRKWKITKLVSRTI